MNDFYFQLSTKFHYGKGVVAGIADEILNYGTKAFSSTMRSRLPCPVPTT